MAIEIRDLSTTDPTVIADCFTTAFEGYYVPVHMTSELLQRRMRWEGLDMRYSFGAFDGERLVGFVLHGIDRRDGVLTAYNGGTGVLAGYRGRGITASIYETIIPVLEGLGVQRFLLEVMQQNEAALKVYSNMGYAIKRSLPCFKGEVKCGHNAGMEIMPIDEPDWDAMIHWWDCQPTWQHAVNTVRNMGADAQCMGAFANGVFIGYACYVPATNRLLQLAVDRDYRRRGAGRALLAAMTQAGLPAVTAINVDGGATDVHEFLEAAGLQQFIAQYEMERIAGANTKG